MGRESLNFQNVYLKAWFWLKIDILSPTCTGGEGVTNLGIGPKILLFRRLPIADKMNYLNFDFIFLPEKKSLTKILTVEF